MAMALRCQPWVVRLGLSVRHASTGQSALAAAFNTKPTRFPFKLPSSTSMGLFGVAALARPEGFHLMKEEVRWRVDDLVAECRDVNRRRKMVDVFDELSDTLCRIADLAEFVRIAHPDQMFGRAAEDACITVSSLVEELNTDAELYEALRRVVADGDTTATTDEDKYVAHLFLDDFEQSGIHLPQKQRSQVVALNDRILQLGQQFATAAHQPRRVQKEDLPPNLRYHFALEGDNVTVSGLYTEAASETAREAAYKIYLHPAEEQEQTLVHLLQARHRLAQLCGYPTYAHRALHGSLAGTPEMVMDLLDSLAAQLKPRAASDYNTMNDLKKKQGHKIKELSMWDTPYLTGVARRELMSQCQDDELSAYFSLGNCMNGLDLLFRTLYGVRLELAPLASNEAWSPDIYKINVVHEEEGLLGTIYCDFYDRPRKPHQDCHFTIVGGKQLPDGSYQNPVVVLMLTLPSPSWNQPSLLTPSMADNLFHEFGHAMHSMLARTRHQHVTGTRCATDLAEVPSILMEFFAADPRVVSRFARHYKTGKALDQRQLQALQVSKNIFAAADMQQQVFYSALDQELHLNPVFKEGIRTTTDVLQQVQQRYYGLPYVPNTAWQHRFSHLVGYGAKYYSYLVSRGVAAWIWQQLFQSDPWSPASGSRFRSGFLAHGGSQPARRMVSDLLGKDVNPSSLSQSLIVDLDLRRRL